MHIPENYLSPETCLTVGVLMLPIWYKSIKTVEVQVKEDSSKIPTLGITTSLAFLVMMFNLPAPGGTTAHAVGAVLIAILLGPWTATLSMSVALAIQAFLFGDGGILALPVNCFVMGFIMPFVGYGVYKTVLEWLKKESIASFLGGYLGVNAAAIAVAFLLGLQPLLFTDSTGNPLYSPYPLQLTMTVMIGTHLIIGLVEGLFTTGVITFLSRTDKKVDLKQSQEGSTFGKVTGILLLISMIILVPLGLLTTGEAFAEWDAEGVAKSIQTYQLNIPTPKNLVERWHFNGLFPDYSIAGITDPLAYILSALTAVLIIFILIRIVFSLRKNSKS